MPADYIEILGDYYPDVEAIAVGDPTVYSNIQFISTVIPQADLDLAYLAKVKTDKILEFSEYARIEITSGFVSSALGFPHMYDAEPEDQLNLIGAVASGTDVLFSCWPTSNGYQEVNLTSSVSGTDSTGFANDTTQYLAQINVNGSATYLAIEGRYAQTYDDLIAQINADADFSVLGKASLVNNTIKIESKLYSSASTVDIVDTNLFTSLAHFVSFGNPVTGADPKTLPKEYKNHTNVQLKEVLNDGKTVKLTILQKFAVKKSQIENATSVTEVDSITW